MIVRERERERGDEKYSCLWFSLFVVVVLLFRSRRNSISFLDEGLFFRFLFPFLQGIPPVPMNKKVKNFKIML